MIEILTIAVIASWTAIGYLWYRQRNLVSSERDGDRVILKDNKGVIKRNIIAE